MKKGKVAMLIMAVLIIVFVSACGKSDSKKNNTAKNGDPVKGGQVTIPLIGDPIFNPWHPNAYAESNLINRVIFSGLTKPDKETSSPSPDLATEWSASEDGLTWTFKLREDVKWHDGEPFTAQDVEYTFNKIVLDKALGSNGASNFKILKDVSIVNDYTVEFHLISAWAALPAYLGFNAEIMPKHLFEGKDPWEFTSFNKENPVGTGPFKMEKYTSGQSIELVANSDYFDGEPYLDKVIYKILADANTQIAQALSNELDIFVLDDKSALERIEKADNLTVLPSATTKYYWLALNQKNDLFQDIKVRQAFMYAIDRQAIIDTVLEGYGQIANAAISPNLTDYYTDDVTRYTYNPKKAKELLAEAGWTDSDGDKILDKDGKSFSFTFEVANQGELQPIAQMVQQYLKEIGLEVKLETLEWNAMIEKNVINRDFEMIVNWWTYPNDPDVLAQYYSANAESGNNIPGYKDEKLDKLLIKGQVTSDVEERKQVYKEVQKYLSETLPYLYLWFPEEIQVRSERVQGVPDTYFGGSLKYINEWWVQS